VTGRLGFDRSGCLNPDSRWTGDKAGGLRRMRMRVQGGLAPEGCEGERAREEGRRDKSAEPDAVPAWPRPRVLVRLERDHPNHRRRLDFSTPRRSPCLRVCAQMPTAVSRRDPVSLRKSHRTRPSSRSVCVVRTASPSIGGRLSSMASLHHHVRHHQAHFTHSPAGPAGSAQRRSTTPRRPISAGTPVEQGPSLGEPPLVASMCLLADEQQLACEKAAGLVGCGSRQLH